MPKFATRTEHVTVPPTLRGYYEQSILDALNEVGICDRAALSVQHVRRPSEVPHAGLHRVYVRKTLDLLVQAQRLRRDEAFFFLTRRTVKSEHEVSP